MDYIFILSLIDHRILGFVFAPYLIQKERGADNYTVIDRVMSANLDLYEHILTPEDILLVKLTEEYGESNLVKIFSKKKLTAREFMKSLEKGDLVESQIRPFIERRMAKCLEILSYNPVPLFHKLLQNRIYGSERINLAYEDVSAVFNFKRHNEGLNYHLSIEHEGSEVSLTGKNGLIVMNEPCSLVLGDTFYVFQDIDGKKLLPFFDKEFIQVPKRAEVKFFESFVRNAIKKYKVNATGFTISEEDNTPKSVLSIESDLTGKLVIVLKFIYGKSIYYANKKSEMKVSLLTEGDQVDFKCLRRNYAYENDCLAQLLSFGLRNEGDAYFRPFSKEKETELSAYTIINWLNINVELLRDSGFEVAQDKLNKDFYLEKFKLRFEVSETDNDWFDVTASVEFDGFTIPFIAFKEHIEKGDREFVLPNGKVMILPEEWFESFRDFLKFARKTKDGLQLEKQHYSLLDQSFGISGDFKDKMLSLAETSTMALQVLPEGLNADLRDYQQLGYSWMYNLYKNGFGGCLADDMGLGKTLQTIALLKRLSKEEILDEEPIEASQQTQQLDLFSQPLISASKKSKASLVIVPTSLVHNWINEIKKFTPSLQVKAYVGGGRGSFADYLKNADIIITSYGILRNDIEELRKYSFLYLILDESQMIKNPGSKTYQAVMMLKPEYRLVLTGTPIENSLTDLWAQMNFLNKGLLGSLNFFKQEFQTPIEKHADENRSKKLQQLIAPFVLRRSKTEVAKELPPLTEQIVYCDMSDQQAVIYEKEKSKARNMVMEKIDQGSFGNSSIFILQSLTKLRQIANHPSLVEADYLGGSGKFEEIRRNLKSLLASGHKALIFSSFVKHLNLVADFLDQEQINYSLLTGETSDREKQVDKFQNDSNCPFFLVSLKAGGVGLNLTAAEYVLILDPWWNPAAEMQAIARAHRIGQQKQVMVYRFIARESLEEKIVKLQERKAELADAFVNENSMKNLSVEDVTELFE